MLSPAPRLRIALLAAIAATTLGFVAPSRAFADVSNSADSIDGGVARISLIQGSVAVQRGDSNAPVEAVTNAPVLGADYLTTGEGGRAEVQFDGSSMVRLNSNVQMRFTQLDSAARELQLAEGTVELRMLRRFDGNTQIDTPSISVRVRDAGSYRVSVTSDGTTQVTVRSGSADIVTPQGDQTLVPGSTLFAEGESSNPSVRTIAEVGVDDFDRFNHERDLRAESALSDGAEYVNPSAAGVDDLDQYGHWVPDGSYGEVWVPGDVAADWAPYRDGRWVWEDGYGWTWLGYEPWGWAPYHYGRWYHSPVYGWAWDPPRPGFVYEPWRPALVAFLGFGGPSVSVGIGFGTIGWVPLAPYEPFHPWWGRTVVNNVTVTNVNVNVTRVYHNAGFGGVTSVPGRRFMLGRFDHPVAVTPAQLREVRVVNGTVPVVPTAANLRFSDRTAPATLAVRSTFVQRSFAGNSVAMHRTPFEEQRTAISTATHLTPSPAAFRSTEHALPSTMRYAPATAVRPEGGASPAERRPASDPWARFSQSRGVSAHGEPAIVRGTGNAPGSPWNRFGTNGTPRSDGRTAPSYRAPSRTYAAPSRPYENRAMQRTAPNVVPHPAPRAGASHAPPHERGGGHPH